MSFQSERMRAALFFSSPIVQLVQFSFSLGAPEMAFLWSRVLLKKDKASSDISAHDSFQIVCTQYRILPCERFDVLLTVRELSAQEARDGCSRDRTDLIYYYIFKRPITVGDVCLVFSGCRRVLAYRLLC